MMSVDFILLLISRQSICRFISTLLPEGWNE